MRWIALAAAAALLPPAGAATARSDQGSERRTPQVIATAVYLLNGRHIGSVETEPHIRRFFGMRPACGDEDLVVYGPDRHGGFRIDSHDGGFSEFAWPRAGTHRRIYYIPATNMTMRWVSRSRRDLYRGRRHVAYTRGPDGVAAGLGFFVNYGDCWK